MAVSAEMGPVLVRVKANALYPLLDDTGVLTCRKVLAGMGATELAVYGEVKQSKVSRLPMDLKQH